LKEFQAFLSSGGVVEMQGCFSSFCFASSEILHFLSVDFGGEFFSKSLPPVAFSASVAFEVAV